MSYEFMPHGHCWFWTDWIVNQTTAANLFIAAAYFAIPAVLIQHVVEFWKKSDFFVRLTVIMFANFIVACGFTHVMQIVEIWLPFYRIGLIFDWWCALSSVATLLMLIWYKK